ncbi:hypothetical protein [Ferruginibacter sp. SUN106]|uniref:hypothetical protein n=1 Tax=Ferruginibacter sp. SUN106 TaxID=2978348 RepID=UPI003D3612AE
MTKRTILAVLLSIFSVIAYAQNNTRDYLNIPGPVVFDSQSFHLDWSSHPAVNFYKQEYLTKNDSAGKYKTMLMMDVITGDKNLKDIVAEKIKELKNLKATNPLISYESFGNAAAGEYMLDFVLTAGTPDGKQLSIAERNVYRYKTFVDKGGKRGVLLFGVSTRAYGKDISNFYAALKTNKSQLVNQVAKYTIPEIKVRK